MTQPKTRRYAQDTTVSSDETVKTIRSELRKRGVEGFYHGDEPGRAVIGFSHSDRVYRFDLPMPDVQDFRLTPGAGTRRGSEAMITAWQQECNRRYRALLATIKGRLIAVDDGISTFDEEFVMEAVMPDGRTTVRQYIAPQIEVMYETGKMPPLLPGPE